MKVEAFNLESYLSTGIDKIIKGIMKASLRNPGAGMYMLQFARDNKNAGEIRNEWSQKGKHIPPFLIASITDKCNLHCKGCYARANKSCTDMGAEGIPLLPASRWEEISRYLPMGQ